jgi:hypothetical protein
MRSLKSSNCWPSVQRDEIGGRTMNIFEFGEALIRTRDLDPVYCAVHAAKLPEPQVSRLLLSYWCFYNLGVAATISEKEGDEFWKFMRIAAVNEEPPRKWNLPGDRWPRASERRHFRGEKCVNAIERFRVGFVQPEAAVRSLAPLTRDTAIIKQVMEWPMCGPWIAFKAADMMERVYGAKVEFDQNIGLMYESPRAGLDQLAADTNRTPEAIYADLLNHFKAYQAPPGEDRCVGPQEVETICCKWASMRAGHYHIGKDLHEVRHALAGWGETAERMLSVMPRQASDAPPSTDSDPSIG